jgi:transmembrane sensor
VNHDSRPTDQPSDRRAWRTDQEWDRLRARIAESELGRSTQPRRFTRWLTAAGVIGVASALAWQFLKPTPAIQRVATTAAGERIVIHLADSSIITLGPASTVRYTVGRDRREASLEGLADFKVVHDAARPFVVRAGNAIATDLGTEFVVRAYRGDSSVNVSVTAGSVSIASAGSQRHVELRAGDVGRVAADGSTSLGTAGSASSHAAWVDGRLVFHDESLATVARELSRWFDVDLRVAGDSLARRRVSAVYNDPSLADVLEALTATLDLRVDRSKRTITLLPRSQ